MKLNMDQHYLKRRKFKNVAKVGFDFETVEDAYTKLEEELDEFKEALKIKIVKKFKMNLETACFH